MHRQSLALIAVVLLSFGCEGNKGPRVYPVKGRVILNGQPAANVRVMFHPEQPWEGTMSVPAAWTEADGTFTLTTFSANDGAPAGDYRVVLEVPEYRTNKGEGPNRMPDPYSNYQTTPLKAHVDPQPNDLAPIEVKVTLKPLKPKTNVEKNQKGKKHD